ncbi:type IV secretory system conjugative DNA transfer family protein [Dactylosporangium sp. NPDC005555]|uniref:type IV secretory system conjugative DNA transfer family protein n=1 Tax=Dactylosporangium sp. NPDC005555 TaxID=3154889 RepID=UPI0033BEB060
MTQPMPLPPFQVEPRRQVYLGLDPGDGLRRCWSGPEDSVGVIGPPRYGKTSGLIIPALMSWAGPAVATSTRGDLLRFCGGWRAQLAAARGGRIYVYDPFGSEPGVTGLRWSPLAGCADPAVCYRRVAAMTGVAARGVTDGEHWRTGAAVILRGVFHAAAVAGADLAQVRRWLAHQDVRTPADILRHTDSAARGWGDDLQAIELIGERERGSFFSVARNCLDATAEPTVLASTAVTDLDLDHFLATSSTLFIVGPSHHQDAIAPLIVGLVDSVAQRAAEIAARSPGGRLADPLLLALDEVANIAPLRSLPSLVSEGGGRGIITLWAAQSLAQLRARYGTDEQQAILAATTAKLIYGGMSNGDDLRNISSWAGEFRDPQVTYYAGGEPTPAMLRGPRPGGGLAGDDVIGRQHAVSGLYRPVLPVEAIQRLPPLHAWLFYRSDAPLLVETRPAGLMEPYRQLADLPWEARPDAEVPR